MSPRSVLICRGEVLTAEKCEAYRENWAESAVEGGKQVSAEVRQKAAGPGTELKKLIEQLGLVERKGCKCRKMARKMNRWGTAGCREHKAEIVAHLNEAYHNLTWTDVAAFALRAAAAGLAFKMATVGPAEWLVSEAIRRSESA
jgi:hypothetical protein